MKKVCLDNKGLSLVEVVMSALIVSVLMAGLYSVYISSRNMTALALNKAVALHWASSQIEGKKNGMQDAYTDPSNNNILASDKGGAVATVDTNYGPPPFVSIIRHSAAVTWTE